MKMTKQQKVLQTYNIIYDCLFGQIKTKFCSRKSKYSFFQKYIWFWRLVVGTTLSPLWIFGAFIWRTNSDFVPGKKRFSCFEQGCLRTKNVLRIGLGDASLTSHWKKMLAVIDRLKNITQKIGPDDWSKMISLIVIVTLKNIYFW